MANRNYNRGRQLEYRTIKNFEAMGCVAMRSAGSHGLADVIAWNEQTIWLIQVKSGNARMTPAEREAFQNMPAPRNAIKQIHEWYKSGGKWVLNIKSLKDMGVNQ